MVIALKVKKRFVGYTAIPEGQEKSQRVVYSLGRERDRRTVPLR
jgi:hypothetical protein